MVATSSHRGPTLDLWAAGLSSSEIADELGLTEEQVQGYISRARAAGDDRAVMRRTAPVLTEAAWAHKDEILDRYAAGWTQYNIARSLGIEQNVVRRLIERCRLRDNDPRAAIQKSVADRDAEKQWKAEPELQPPIPLAKLKFLDTPMALRPVVYSVDRAKTRATSLTAQLMGDPPPHRSALGREIRPDEWASKPGQGRHSRLDFYDGAY